MNGVWFVTFLPIVIVIAIIFIARYVLAQVKLWTPKRIFTFIGIYLALGTISLIGIAVMSDNRTKSVSEQQLQQALAESKEVNQYINNDVKLIDPKFIKDEKRFTTTSDKLTVMVGEDAYSANIIVTWNDEKIDDVIATLYQLPYIVFGIDISDRVPPLQVQYENNELAINVQRIELKYASFKPHLEVFKSHLGNDNSLLAYNHFTGKRILHLNVPKHINIIDNSGWISYLYN